MNVAVIGGGAIGLLLSYYILKNVGHTTLYVRRQEQAEQLNRAGLELSKKGTASEVDISAKWLQETEIIEADLVVVAVKQYNLAEVADILRSQVSETARLLFIQNGMSHVKVMETLPQAHIYVGIVEHGALKTDENKVAHTGEGIIKLAAFRGDLKNIIWDKLANPEFPLEFHEDWYQLMAEKLLVNAVINPLTALYGVENGVLLDREGYRRNMRRLFDEAFSILDLDDMEKYWENVLTICRKTANNRSSMLRDVETGRLTEIDAISGYLLERAGVQNISLPNTAFVYDSIKGLSVPPAKSF